MHDDSEIGSGHIEVSLYADSNLSVPERTTKNKQNFVTREHLNDSNVSLHRFRFFELLTLATWDADQIPSRHNWQYTRIRWNCLLDEMCIQHINKNKLNECLFEMRKPGMIKRKQNERACAHTHPTQKYILTHTKSNANTATAIKSHIEPLSKHFYISSYNYQTAKM